MLPIRFFLSLRRQFTAFFGVGIVAAIAHYGVLIALVELGSVRPVRATLAGYGAGGILSYILNRTHTFASSRPHRESVWRFIFVAAVGFGLTWMCMKILVDGMGGPYLPAQIATTGLVMIWSFIAHKAWTFA